MSSSFLLIVLVYATIYGRGGYSLVSVVLSSTIFKVEGGNILSECKCSDHVGPSGSHDTDLVISESTNILI